VYSLWSQEISLYVLMNFWDPLDNAPISSENSVYWVIALISILYLIGVNWWENKGFTNPWIFL